MISTLTERLEASLDSYVKNLDDRIVCLQRHIDALKKDYNDSVTNLTKIVNDVRSAHLTKLQQLDRLETAHDLVITGIPYRRNEDLLHIYHSIARSIGVGETTETMVHLRRLSRYPLRLGSSPPILCQFAFRETRNDFFKKYLHRRSLALDHIGFGSNDRIYVNERLLPLTRRILNAAIQLRNEGRIHRVLTRNGLVSVMINKTTDAVVVDRLDKLILLSTYLSK